MNINMMGEEVEMTEKQITAVFKALCDENRIKLLRMLYDGEKCAYLLLEEMHFTQPTLSHHMKILCDNGLVNGRKEGKWMYYSLSESGLQTAADFIMELSPEKGSRSSCSDEAC